MAPKKAEAGRAIYRMTTKGGVFAEVGGQEVHIKEGDLVYEGSNLLKALPDHFELADDLIRPDIEDATATPGKKRGA